MHALTPRNFSDLENWHGTDHALALQAFQRSAREILEHGIGFRRQAAFGGQREDWLNICGTALTATDAKTFFEENFRAFAVADVEKPEGLFTGYYEPLVQGALVQSADYPVPVYAKPKDLIAFSPEEATATGLSYGRRVDGKPQAYDTRHNIENGSLQGRADIICWLTDWVDAFFMHVQGQGKVQLPDGSAFRLSYAGKSGHPYTGIGHVLIAKGVAPREKMSMQVLRDWMKNHPHDARALMWKNHSYIFFQRVEVADETLGGVGAAKVNLTPLHSLAVDRAWWMFGTPLWINTALPTEAAKANARISRLMIAQDTGSAIKGIVRGDFYWGWGQEAEVIAGHMKSPGSMTTLLPLPLARKLGHLS
jgi:membrane-bound lytic murein transglycosylase A